MKKDKGSKGQKEKRTAMLKGEKDKRRNGVKDIVKVNVIVKVGVAVAVLTCLAGCVHKEQNTFVTGADMGWITEMEHEGITIKDQDGKVTEPTKLMRDYGMQVVRIRVWVDPIQHGNWCSKEDALNKALRAKALGMDIMLDFHYSDWWADPGKQNIPAAWSGHTYEQMQEDLRAHTVEVLEFMKTYGIEPRWVQVGNETTYGFLWSVRTDSVTGWPIPDPETGENVIVEDMARAETNPEHYAGLFKVGYEAVKSVCPNAIVIVHLDNGYNRELYEKNLSILVENGAKFDMIGMSLYPYWAEQEGITTDIIQPCIDNIPYLAKRFGTDVMIVEVGMDAYQPDLGYEQLRRLLRLAKDSTENHCRGVIYWEPECRPAQYRLGAFDDNGLPTKIMDAFAEINP